MWISDFAIKNPVITSVCMLALVVFGSAALWALDTDEYPDVEPPIVAVSIPYPGASPEGVEREILEPLEEGFASISGLKELRSTAMDGFAFITAEFQFSKDLNQATQDIRDAISENRRDLPPEMEEPVLQRFDPNDLPIMSLTLSSDSKSVEELTLLADPGITSDLRSLSGVAEVNVVGERERELTVALHPAALKANDISVAQVVEALRAQNLAAPVGRISGELRERTIRLRGRFRDPRDFADLVVSRSGTPIRLGQVATVEDGTEEPRSLALYDSHPAVGIEVVKAKGYSTTDVASRVQRHVAELKQKLPPDVQLRVVKDAGTRVENSVDDVKRSLIEGAVLTVLVVFLFLNSWRSTVITGLALPVSVLASFVAVWAFGFTLNTMSLLGLSLAIGILIDDAIVVRENIVRHVQMGKDHVTAAREGTAEIGLAVAATTFSIVVVFVPVAFMGGVAEQWFAPFALTIACSVLVSLFVSFSLDPMLSAHWADPELEQGKKNWLSRRLSGFSAWFDRRTDGYKRVIGWALRHRLLTAVLAVGSLVAALALPATGVIGSEFFPRQDRSEFNIKLETPPGSNYEYMRRKMLEAQDIAKQLPEVSYTYATLANQGESVDEAQVYVKLVPKSDRDRDQASVADAIRRRISAVSGVKASLSTGSFGPDKQIQIQIKGPNLQALNQLAERVAEEVRKVPGAADVGLSNKGQKPEVQIELDRQLAGQLGISAGQVAQTLRPAFAGIDVGDWVDPTGETRDVQVRLAEESRSSERDIRSLPVPVPAASQTASVPLGQVARVETGLGPTQISHLNRDRIITVGANTVGRPLSAVVSDIQARIADLPLQRGYTIQQGGETEDQQEVFGRILGALGVAVTLMYFVLVVQFRSFLDPVPIMASLPLSLIGVMLALLVTGSTLNIMSMIGVILLVGIVAKNAILLIDFAKWSEEGGKPRHEAIAEAGAVRLRPILMTSFAVVAGMVPVAIGFGEGAEFRAPLGRAVIGGIISSTLLTLLVIPTFYDLLASLRDRARRVAQRRQGRHHTERAAAQ